MKTLILVMTVGIFLTVAGLGFYVEFRFNVLTLQMAESAKVQDSEEYGDDVPVRARDCNGVISEGLALSDWERQYKIHSCFTGEWIYLDDKIECPNCGFLLPDFDIYNDDDQRTCQRCGLHMEAAGNHLGVKGSVWKGERYKED